MFRLPIIYRSAREPCRALGCRTVSTGGDDDNTKGKDQLHKTSHVDETSTDKNAKKQEQLNKREAAKTKLADLLFSLSAKSETSPAVKVPHRPNLQIARPKRPTKIDPEERKINEEFQGMDEKVVEAIKSVSEEVGGGVKTQSQLLQSLQNLQNKGPDEAPAPSMMDVLSGMSVEKRTTPFSRQNLTYDLEQPSQVIDLFGSQPLNIFPVEEEEKVKPEQTLPALATWDAEVARSLETSVNAIPSNPFQEMILWTNQGKIWTFPIDNEIGLQEEKKIGFHEHIFLDRFLSPWCPRAGPIRHFMELVCVGLSKNPHITVQRKKAHIMWYRDFFEEKKQLLQEVGAIPADADAGSEVQGDA